ncbi:MAG: DUF3833 domain-containing protein [Rubrivivax sp.]
MNDRSMTPVARWRSTLAASAVMAATVLGTGCASPTVADYANRTPVLDIRQYLNGELTAHGLFSDRSGSVKRRFVVQLTGTWSGSQGTLDERFTYDDGQTERRVWRITDEGNGRYTGRADDVIGVAEGHSAGNALRWRYTLALPVDGTVREVQFDDWMFLIDERVMLNLASVSKFGFEVGRVTLSFDKKAVPIAVPATLKRAL